MLKRMGDMLVQMDNVSHIIVNRNSGKIVVYMVNNETLVFDNISQLDIAGVYQKLFGVGSSALVDPMAPPAQDGQSPSETVNDPSLAPDLPPKRGPGRPPKQVVY